MVSDNGVAIWDNRSTYHAATYDYDSKGLRTGQRCVGIGEVRFSNSSVPTMTNNNHSALTSTLLPRASVRPRVRSIWSLVRVSPSSKCLLHRYSSFLFREDLWSLEDISSLFYRCF